MFWTSSSCPILWNFINKLFKIQLIHYQKITLIEPSELELFQIWECIHSSTARYEPNGFQICDDENILEVIEADYGSTSSATFMFKPTKMQGRHKKFQAHVPILQFEYKNNLQRFNLLQGGYFFDFCTVRSKICVRLRNLVFFGLFQNNFRQKSQIELEFEINRIPLYQSTTQKGPVSFIKIKEADCTAAAASAMESDTFEEKGQPAFATGLPHLKLSISAIFKMSNKITS